MSEGDPNRQKMDPAAALRAIARLIGLIAAYSALLTRLRATHVNPASFSVLGQPAAAGQQAKKAELETHAAMMLVLLTAMREALERAVDTSVKQDESVAEILMAAARQLEDDEAAARALGFTAHHRGA